MQEAKEIIKRIYFQDARNMSAVADKTAQLILLSPPYPEWGHHSRSAKEKEFNFLTELLAECSRIVKDDGVVATINTDFRDKGMMYLRHMALVRAALDVGLNVKDSKIWIRGFKRDRYRKKFSFIYVFSKQKKVFFNHLPEYEVDNWVYTKPQIINNFRDAIAPEIFQLLIKRYSNPKDLIVCSCAGSGTGLIMAAREERNAIGYEINKNMKNIIKERTRSIEKYFSEEKSR